MAAKFFSSGCLLLELRDNIEHQQTLYHLCLVSRSFYNIFVEKLCRVLNWKSSKLDTFRKPPRMCYSTKHLDFTKIIAIDADEGYLNTGTGNWELMFKQLRDLNRGLTDIILDSPKLRAFSNRSIMLTPDTLKALLLRSHLCDLTFSVSAATRRYWDEDKAHQYGILQDVLLEVNSLQEYIPQFNNLHSLRLYNLILVGDLQWYSTIAKVLYHNPNLKHLGLSVGDNARESWGNEPPDYEIFFSSICTAYATLVRTDTNSLKLQVLELGHAIGSITASDVCKLTDLHYLESIFIDNDSIMYDGGVLPWDMLSPTITPSLRQISLQCLDNSVCIEMERLFDMGRRIEAFYAFDFDDYLRGETRQSSCILGLLGDKCRLPASELILPGRRLALYTTELVKRISSCDWITHLALSIRHDQDRGSTVDQLHEALTPIYEMISGMKALQVLWLPRIYPWGDHTYQAEANADICAPILSHMAKRCPSLNLVQLSIYLWRIHRDKTGNSEIIRLEQLDKFERKRELARHFEVSDLAYWADTH